MSTVLQELEHAKKMTAYTIKPTTLPAVPFTPERLGATVVRVLAIKNAARMPMRRISL